ncbi:hypothetical protein AAE478_010302 [Parahypoxylon ruwenzoriense]
MLANSYAAEIFGELTFISMIGQIWVLPFLIYLNIAGTAHVSRWTIWIVTTLLLGYPNAAWNSRNFNAVRSRTVSAACYDMFCQAGGIIASNIYRADDAPLYRRGNRQLIAILGMNIGLYGLIKVYYILRNRHRDRIWNAMTPEEKIEYLSTTKDEGNKRFDFRFEH